MHPFSSLVRNLTNPMTNYLSMKLLCCFLVFGGLLTNSSFAQTTSSQRTPSTTQTGSTSVVSNRQQELYDQYHGYNKKTASAAPAPVDKSATNQQPVVKADNSSTAKTNQSVQEKSKNPSTTQPVAEARTAAPRQPESIEGSPSSRFRIGVRGGVTYPFYIEKNPLIDPVPGFVGGVTFTLGAGAVSFQPEVNYVRNSAKVTLFPNVTSTLAQDDIQIPLLLKFSSGSYAGSRFFVNVGPYASYALSASQDGKKYSLSGDKDRFTFGAAAGVGAAIKAGPGHVTIEARGLYFLGNTDSGFSTDSKTISGQGTIGYIFPLGGVR